MGYVNQSGSDGVIASANIHMRGNRYVVRTEYSKSTYYYYPIGHCTFGRSVYFGYDKTSSSYYCMYVDGMNFRYIYDSTGNFSLRVKGSSTYKEVIDVNPATGMYGDADFRTKLHCDLPKTDCAITYEPVDTCRYYINDTLILTASSFDNVLPYFNFQQSCDATPVTESGTFTPGTSGSKSWSINVYSYNWNYDEHKHSVKNTSTGEFYNFSLNGHYLSWQGSGKIEGGTISKNDVYSGQYQYVIEGGNLNNTSQLEFSADGYTWTGLTSPVINIGSYTGTISLVNNSSYTAVRTSPAFTTTSGSGGTWNVSSQNTLPTSIGNVTCTNPEYINDYEQGASHDRNGKYPWEEGYDPDNVEQIRNGIFKICPKFTEDGTALLSKTTQTLTDSTWTGVNCTISNGQAVATGENAYIYQDYYRPIYGNSWVTEKDPNGILNNTEYRQRHFTHYRYMMSSFGIKYTGETDFSEYNPTIDLIYKPVGDHAGHTWQAEYNSTIGYYDLLKCNMQETSSADEYCAMCMPDFQELHSENVTYIYESPCTAYGYLPNVVGRIKIPIPQNCVVNIGELNSVYLANYITVREPVDDLEEWESLTSLLEYDDVLGVGFSTKQGKLYIESTVTPTSWTVNSTNVTDTWQMLSNVTSATFTIVCDGWTNSIVKNFTSPVMLKFRKYADTQPFYTEYGIEWYYLEKDDDDEYEYDSEEDQWYRLRRHDIGYNIEVGSEFQEPAYYGLHEPKEEDDTEGNTYPLYENRFLVFTINGARSFEIPEVRRVYNSNTEIETWNAIKLEHLKITDTNNKGQRDIFHRDDLGEITFNLDTYTADDDGDFPIGDLFNGNGGLINWLVVYSVKRTDTEGNAYWCQNVKIRPRFDTLSGTELYRFLNSGNTTLKVKGDFGAVFSGINSADTVGSITDQSYYNNSETLSFGTSTYYTSKLHGTKDSPQTNISLTSSNKTRTFDKVVDGCKYWWSVGYRVLSAGKILRNSAGKILRNSLNKILRGSDY